MLNIYNPNNHDGDKTAGLVPPPDKGRTDSLSIAPPINPPAGKIPAPGKPNAQPAAIVKIKPAKYEDPTKEFTSQELKWSFWYVKNKTILYKILLAILFIINAGLVLFNVWRWGDYLAGLTDSQKVDQSLTASVNYMGIHDHFAAQPVQVLNTQIFSSRENKYDAVAELVNPNSRFVVWFNYYFVIDGVTTSLQKTFLLPGESRFVAKLGIDNGTGGAPAVVLENVKYERIPNHEIPDTVSYQTYRLNFQVSDFVFVKGLAQTGNNADALQFKLTNASPYSYVAPDFYVALLQNGQMVGILPLHLESINSLETKNIDLRNFVPNLNISEIAVYPIINVYDTSVYAP